MLDLEILDFDHFSPFQLIAENILHTSVELQHFWLHTLLMAPYFPCHDCGRYLPTSYAIPPLLL